MDNLFGEEIVNVFEANWPRVEDLKREQLGDDGINKIINHLENKTQPDFSSELKQYKTVYKGEMP